VALALGMLATGKYDVAFWTVQPVNQFVEQQGIRCFVHDLDTDDMMRRVQNKWEHTVSGKVHSQYDVTKKGWNVDVNSQRKGLFCFKKSMNITPKS
jgi:hypothetical protein